MGLRCRRVPEGVYVSFVFGCVLTFEQGSINNRINILYFLDSLCEASLVVKSHPSMAAPPGAPATSLYVDYVTRDLGKIVDLVVPEGREGLPNMMSTKQVRPAQIHRLDCSHQE